MNQSPAFQLYAKDFISSMDVQLMTAQEVGAYCLLLFNSWIQEKQCFLPNDEKILKRLSKLDSRSWNKSRVALLKKFKVSEDAKYLCNERLLQELHKQQVRREALSKGGKSGNAKRWGGNREAIANHRSSFSSSSSIVTLAHFDHFWEAYPKKKSKGQAKKAWTKINPQATFLETIMQSLEKAKNSGQWQKENGRFIPYPATWLNSEGWSDEYEPSNITRGRDSIVC